MSLFFVVWYWVNYITKVCFGEVYIPSVLKFQYHSDTEHEPYSNLCKNLITMAEQDMDEVVSTIRRLLVECGMGLEEYLEHPVTAPIKVAVQDVIRTKQDIFSNFLTNINSVEDLETLGHAITTLNDYPSPNMGRVVCGIAFSVYVVQTVCKRKPLLVRCCLDIFTRATVQALNVNWFLQEGGWPALASFCKVVNSPSPRSRWLFPMFAISGLVLTVGVARNMVHFT
ncbi:v-Bcl-2 protein [Bovine gammaherpesvirus 4]|uniref:V-Bcl-2 protein n=2 Tax=Bovine herpesvirus 4 TaxID=10385 RepID=A0A858PWQ1_BHV4|nr:v-Bcl-2 protein [Bovine gammaherpesvirus 4]AAK07935.1 v-Bcl-2 protein [Bovine gammaherpesvirus 4]AAY21844.1 v-Bcl-2-like protein [Bovine gammaherpesvirus 4]QJC19123.1 v-Bcl-2 protein [Bovine gammaherpesvirus 4]